MNEKCIKTVIPCKNTVPALMNDAKGNSEFCFPETVNVCAVYQFVRFSEYRLYTVEALFTDTVERLGSSRNASRCVTTTITAAEETMIIIIICRKRTTLQTTAFSNPHLNSRANSILILVSGRGHLEGSFSYYSSGHLRELFS